MLKENINILANLSNTFEQSINELKKITVKINDKKEELKKKIQKIFTSIRSKLNEREDQLLLEVDNQFNNLFVKEELIRNIDKLANKIEISLERGKVINKDWNDNSKLSLLINDCINIEKNTQDLKTVNESFKNCNKEKIDKIKFIPEDESKINIFLKEIQSFGSIYYDNTCFKAKKCSLNENNDLKYEIRGDKNNIVTKTGTDKKWICIVGQKELENNKYYKWKIKILESKNYYINIGITSIDYMDKTKNYKNGWYLYCYDFSLYSGPPHNFEEKNTGLKKSNEIIIEMDMNKGILKFKTEDEDEGDCYTGIPLDKPLIPSILLYNQDDSIEILE